MSKKSIASSGTSISNRSPWMVRVRTFPALDRQFRYGDQITAQAYLQQMQAQGRRATLGQLETAFQLRVRRQGLKTSTITFDTLAQAEQAALKIKSELSVSIVRDYAVAAQTTLRTLMERYRDDVAAQHKGAAIEIGRLDFPRN